MKTNLESLLYLSFLPRLGHLTVRKLLHEINNPQELLEELKSGNLRNKLPAAQQWTRSIHEKVKQSVNSELEFCQKMEIKVIPFYDSAYPKLLNECVDAPVILFARGSFNFNDKLNISVVGTRSQTAYGKSCIQELVSGLSKHKTCIVSGLALGCDQTAHQAALENNLSTVAVMAHGVDKVFPKSNKKLAEQMLENGGGLVSEFPSFVPPEPTNFLIRNRVVAGISRATIVVESDIRGGSMSTATFANGYNREVFAFPGRINDKFSNGCNHLILNNKAGLIRNSGDVLNLLNLKKRKTKVIQKTLLISLTPEQEKIVKQLQAEKKLSLDQLSQKLETNSYKLLPILLELEIKGVVRSLSGKSYELI